MQLLNMTRMAFACVPSLKGESFNKPSASFSVSLWLILDFWSRGGIMNQKLYQLAVRIRQELSDIDYILKRANAG